MRLHEVFDDNERDVYHHTSAEPFDQFKPFRGVIYTAQNPKHADAGAKVARREFGRPKNTGNPRTMPLKIKGAIAFMDAPPVIKWPQSFRGEDDYYDIERHERYLEYLKAWSAPGLTARGLAFARKVLLDYYDAAYDPITGDVLPPDQVQRNLKHDAISWPNLEGGPFAKEHVPADNDYEPSQLMVMAPYGADDERSTYQDALKALGYAGTRVADETGSTIAMFHPDHIRSRFAN